MLAIIFHLVFASSHLVDNLPPFPCPSFSSFLFFQELWHFNPADIFQHIMKNHSAFSWFSDFLVLWQQKLVDLVKLENVTLLFGSWWMHAHEYSSMQKQLKAALKGTRMQATLWWSSPGGVFRASHRWSKVRSLFVSEKDQQSRLETFLRKHNGFCK